ncbi:hypothetical protein [Mycobacterium sherrisii]|uniref:hypothetical protein n=1 Tax=Mycobacterium sherrisii TaxID=243061 RepID=UPI001154D9AA|nr:hypothetical protein [Mycobacterium sherrisii]MCV7031387.1 hypothetical protein [Mycobacterium sherrisii]MEC4764967.1 hypothetical protein [Mycobacterium sherrisii]
MTFVVAQRFHGVAERSMLRAGRLLRDKWCSLRIPSYDERPYRYVSQTPVAVISPGRDGLAPPGRDGHR